MKAWFLSDLHLKSLNERNGNILLRFLHSLVDGEHEITHLFLLGDIFDLWVGGHDFYAKKFQPIVDAILELKKKGIEIYYFEGNHDLHIDRFWQERMGIPVYVDPKYFQLGPWVVRCEHGDFINPDDKAYERYRKFVRHPIMNLVAQVTPPAWMYEFGKKASQTSRHFSAKERSDKEQELKRMIRQYSEEAFRQIPFDFLIGGHMHVRDDWQFTASGKTVHSINLGSWFTDPAAYLLTEIEGQWVGLK
ncbi:MAG: UDP-2,3-diacylglucosamine hydrolase [Oligoflexia bacterium]|nr:MAG: UDP-2,3-diacylglucosamine hydrolase [Oligoflexia bacterium]